MEQSSVFDKNPWENDETSLGSVKHVIALAKSTGHITTNLNDNSKLEDLLADSDGKFQSLKLMKVMRQIDQCRNHLEKVILEIQERLSDKETRDLTHQDILEKKIEDVNRLNAHLQTVVNEKDQLISKLQQPYVGDFLKIESSYKRYVSETFPQISPVLSELNSHLDNIAWAGKVDLADGQLETILSSVSSNLAAFQSGFHEMCQMEQAMTNLHRKQFDIQNSSGFS